MANSKKKELNKVKELVELMKENDLCEIEIVEGENKIHLKRPQPQVTALPQMAMPQYAAPAAAPQAPASGAVPAETTEEDTSNLIEITSPMVGTFYSSPSPDSDPYVSVGDTVGPETVVCIIEAMKVMNEIKAETSGTIAEVNCQAGQAVEFGEVLFKVKPS